MNYPEDDYGPESVIVAGHEVEVRVPAWPQPCSFVRVVARKTGKELLYWVCDEWTEEDPANDANTAIGAIFAVIKLVAEGATVKAIKKPPKGRRG